MFMDKYGRGRTESGSYYDRWQINQALGEGPPPAVATLFTNDPAKLRAASQLREEVQGVAGALAGVAKARQQIQNSVQQGFAGRPSAQISRSAIPDGSPVPGRGSALQANIGVNLRGIPIRSELAVEARWIGRVEGRSNTLGYERGVLFKELQQRYPDLFPDISRNPIITKEFASRFPEFGPYVGEKLVEHHVAHGSLTYPVPASLHLSESRFLHGTAKNIGGTTEK